MNKQKKQLLLLVLVLALAIVAFVWVSKLPAEEEAEEAIRYTVIELDAEAVNKVSFTNETGTYILNKAEEEWTYNGNKTLDIDEDEVLQMVKKVAALTSENCIEQVTDLSMYGLDTPMITILLSDGSTSYTLLVGDYNDVTYTQYVCLESDKETVYTTAAYNISSFKEGIDELIVVKEETQSVTTEAEE